MAVITALIGPKPSRALYSQVQALYRPSKLPYGGKDRSIRHHAVPQHLPLGVHANVWQAW
jgi:hypothetical protein